MIDAIPEQFGLFLSPEGNLALAAGKLIQVIEQPHIYAAPGLSARVTGLVLYHQQVVPVLRPRADAEVLLVVPPYVVLCGSSMGLVGFACETVKQVVAREQGTFDASAENPVAGSLGSFLYQSDAYTVIDVDLLVECLPE